MMAFEGQVDELFRIFSLHGDYEFVKNRHERIYVMMELDQKNPRTPREVLNNLKNKKYHFSTVSRALASLESRKVCKCLNGDAEVNRKYVLTKKGALFKDYIEKEEKENAEQDNE